MLYRFHALLYAVLLKAFKRREAAVMLNNPTTEVGAAEDRERTPQI